MAEHGSGPPPLFGLAAEFAEPAALLHAASEARRHGFTRVDAYTPVPVPELDDLLGGGAHITRIGIAAALLGGAGFFGLCCWQTMVEYPFLIGGRPFFSWPYFVIPSFSVAMLVGSVVTLLATLLLSRLPRLNHPVFNIRGIERATRDRYFLTIEARREGFDADAAQHFLHSLSPAPLSIQRVPR